MATKENKKTTLPATVFFDQAGVRAFLNFILKTSNVIAPVKIGPDKYDWRQISGAAEAALDYPRTLHPLKKYFLDRRKSESDSCETDKQRKTIFFAVHPYEPEGIFTLANRITRADEAGKRLPHNDQFMFIGTSYSDEYDSFMSHVSIEPEDLKGFSLYFDRQKDGYNVFIPDEEGRILLKDFESYQAKRIRFENLKRYVLDEKKIRAFIDFLRKKATVITAHKYGEQSYRYQEVDDANAVALDYPRTIQPLKKFFLPPRETLLTYDIEDNRFAKENIVSEKRIFFGIHSYEMQAVRRLDYSFSKDNPESNYLTRRDNSQFIGISHKPDQWHFSKDLDQAPDDLEGFCIYIDHQNEAFHVFILNDEGQEMANDFFKDMRPAAEPYRFSEQNVQFVIDVHHSQLPAFFEAAYHAPVWDKVAGQCLGCGTCNLLCPTCYCFDVRDEVDLNIRDGKRERLWDGCMLNTFAEVAGGKNFRKKLSSRTRHRLYRKFKYSFEQNGKLNCVGCGRCSRYCPAEISIVDILNRLIADCKQQEYEI